MFHALFGVKTLSGTLFAPPLKIPGYGTRLDYFKKVYEATDEMMADMTANQGEFNTSVASLEDDFTTNGFQSVFKSKNVPPESDDDAHIAATFENTTAGNPRSVLTNPRNPRQFNIIEGGRQCVSHFLYQ